MKTKHFLSFLGSVATIVLLLSNAIVLSDSSHMSMVVGEQKTIDGSNVAKVTVGDLQIVNVKTTSKEVILFAQSKGTTNVTLTDKQGGQQELMITVLSLDPNKLKSDLESLLSDIEGVEVKIVGDNVFIDGELFREKDLERVNKVAESLGSQVKVLASLNQSYVPQKENIDIRIDFLELTQDVASKLGISWSKALSGLGSFDASFQRDKGGSTTGSINWSVLSNLNAAINITGQDANSKIWHTDHFTTVNGTKGEYFAGGTIYVKNTTEETSALEKILFGTLIKALPRLSGSKMLIDVEAEISSIDPSAELKTDGIPATRNKRITTSVSMQMGESVILGGLIDRIKVKNYEKIPGLGDIPVLGYLFKSKQYQNGQTEAVVIMTPTTMTSSDPDHKKKMEEMQKQFNAK